MSHYPFDNFINSDLDTDGFEPISDNEGEPGPDYDLNAPEHEPDEHRGAQRDGGGPVVLDAPDGDDGSEEETLRIEQRAHPTLSELFSHAGDNPDIDDLFGDFMDTLPDPNSTSLWESKLDDLQLQLRGLVTNEVYQNFVDGHYPEWMPDANDFATLDAWKRACKQEVVKVKYLISFSISLMTLAEDHLRRTMGNE